MSAIKVRMIKLELMVSESKLAQYGGIQKYKELLYDILDRYGNEEYFDKDMIKEQAAGG